ncbi:hypothetical protein BGX34_008753, partial [Mortierella sp. NVP85]
FEDPIELEASRGTIRFAVHTPQPAEELLNVSITMDLSYLEMDKIDYISFRHYSEDHHGAPEVREIDTMTEDSNMAESHGTNHGDRHVRQAFTSEELKAQ